MAQRGTRTAPSVESGLEPLVLPLSEIDASMVELVGGKAANLGELIGAGFPVPQGFCLTTAAFRVVAGTTCLAALLAGNDPTSKGRTGAGPVSDGPTRDDWSGHGPTRNAAELAAAARRLVADAPMPDGIRQAVLAAYRGLGRQAMVAVRSSATAEDLPFASFAGQQDTYLGVLGEDQLMDAVRRCWASLFTERATAYRDTQHIDHRTARLAVVVQVMVRSAVAGVLFTANPVTGRRREAVIDASPGLGEAVVSGAVTPDRLVIDTASGRILESRIAERSFAIRTVSAGGTERVPLQAPATKASGAIQNSRRAPKLLGDAGAELFSALQSPATKSSGAIQYSRRAPKLLGDAGAELFSALHSGDGSGCLTDEQAAVLAATGDRVERHYGAPQDIEWAFDDAGTLWLTQSRPITTLYPLPEDAPAGPGLRVYFCFSVAQGLYRPITPMGLSAFRVLTSGAALLFNGEEAADPLAGLPLYTEAGQRIFFDLTGALRSRVGRVVMPKVFDLMETRSATVMRGLFERPEFSVKHRSVRPAARRVVRVMVRFRIPLYAVQGVINPAAAQARVRRISGAFPGRLAVAVDLSPRQRLEHAIDVLYRESLPMAPRVVPAALAGLAMFGLAARLLRGIAEPGELQGVLRGVPDNVTTDMDLALWALVQRVRRDADSAGTLDSTPPNVLAARFAAGTLPAALQSGVGTFLGRFGHRAIAEIDVGVPRWSEDPTHLFGVLANYLQLTDPALAPDVLFARSAREAAGVVNRLSRAAGERARWRGAVVRFALGRARRLAGIREMPKYAIVQALAAVRADLAAVGTALAGEGRIDNADDVFFLTLGEAGAALSGRSLHELVLDRRAVYQRELRRRRVPRVMLSDGTEPENTAETASGDSGSMMGVAASPGSVTGTARVILDPVGARITPGEILVAPSTDPGWTPLFLTAGGLVMEMGGANSHGAVVAREYGIPAVVGVPRATEVVSTGDRLRVDGTAGTVQVVQNDNE